MANQQLHTIQDKVKQKNELPLGSRDREDLVKEIKNQVSTSSCGKKLAQFWVGTSTTPSQLGV